MVYDKPASAKALMLFSTNTRTIGFVGLKRFWPTLLDEAVEKHSWQRNIRRDEITGVKDE
ncbi:hypothetical protein PY650_34755 [Rhizobium calliandrae]|uniref:Uncharacterized protein n=1 Tax=Rhizobium calliandrae TaxID=1312182 RepID=A0ABT7KPU3_9HYPH|nr:hypothetical protein [Rhizobium calliandrae]MDL2410641.1 hypothetical protein [Rhizobium calliandrae]